MKVESIKINEANAKIEAEISKKIYGEIIEKITKNIAKNASISGFRKGKVPTSLIKKRYEGQIEQDAKSDLFQQIYSKGVAALDNKEVIGDPFITKFEQEGDIFKAEVKLSLRPKIDLGDYLSHVPSFKTKPITQKQVDEKLKDIARSFGTPKKARKDAKLKEGQIATIDFEGKIDGKAFDGGTAKGYQLMIGSKTFIEGFEEALVGMKKDEEKDINLRFPENYQSTNLAGKDVVFSVKVQEIQNLEVPEIDDELAKKVLPGDKEANVEKLITLLKAELERSEITKLFNEKLRDELLQNLDKAYTFDLPEIIVEQEMSYQLDTKIRQMTEKEIKALQENQDKVKDLRESFKEDAKQKIKTTMIIDNFAKELKISVSDAEVEQILYYEAMRMGSNPKETLEAYKSNNMLSFVKMSIIEDRVLKTLIDKKNPRQDLENKKEEKSAKKPATKSTTEKKDGK